MKTLDPVNITNIKQCLSFLASIRKSASKNDKWAHELSLPDFIRAMSCLTAQSYGSRIEEKICDMLNLQRTDDVNRGDRKSNNGKYFEFKCSVLTSSNKFINIVQIRPWQDTNYICAAFDISSADNVGINFFYLSKAQMQSELKRSKAASAHGTVISNEDNHNNELAIRIKPHSNTYNRWIKEYGITIDALHNKINKHKH